MHNIEHYDYPENIHRDYVQRELDHHAAMADYQEGCTGLGRAIRWLDTHPICNDSDDAEKVLKKYDRGNYDQLAVRYYAPARDAKPTKAQEGLEAKRKAALMAYKEKAAIVWAQTVSADFVTCKECGSRLCARLVRTNACPVCRAELRTSTMLKQVEAAKAKWDKSEAALREYIRDHGKKEVRWLVKIEYHT